METRIKICGITRPEDGLAAAHLGADAIGLVFYDRSSRAVTVEQARQVVAALPPFVAAVGLFVNGAAEWIRAVLDGVVLDYLQFHGDETPEQCSLYGKRYIKAIRVRDGVDLASEAARYANAAALLLDTYKEGQYGGTGQAFDWSRVPQDLPKPLILAGGLTPDNVGDCIRQVRPYAVDVSGGVEAGKGIKDAAKMAAFIRGVKRVDPT